MTTDAERSYRGFLDAVNRQDLDACEQYVDVDRYRENCVGFTRGFVGWAEAKVSVRQVWAGIPDLQVEIHDLVVGPDVVLAHGVARGRNTGRLYGAPATGKRYAASYFDLVRLRDGLIVHRVQQADVLGQMRQMYGRMLGTVAVGALVVRQPAIQSEEVVGDGRR